MNNIGITRYSVVTMLVIMPILIVGLYFVRKSKYFIRYFGVNSMLILYFLCAFRMCVPLEFPGVTLFINDGVFFTDIQDTLYGNTEATQNLLLRPIDMLLILWGLGTLIYLSVVLLRYNLSTKKYLKGATAFPKDLKVYKDEYKIKSNINLVCSQVAVAPMSFGIFRKYILLPFRDYTEEEFQYILAHECVHIKNKDTLIKLLTEIFVGIFWWNPFSYLLKRDLSHVLEIKCDQRVLESKSKAERVGYFEVLLSEMKAEKRVKASPMLTAEFAYKEEEKRTIQRFKCILEKREHKKKALVINTVILVCASALILSSYLVQWRPQYLDERPAYDEEGNILSTEDNSYVLHKKDGTYQFVFQGYYIDITEEEMDAGYYEYYPIVEEE